MPRLEAIQRAFTRSILDPTAAAAVSGPAYEALVAIHRNTVFEGLQRALRLTYPTVATWLGDDQFEAAALSFAQANPPVAPALDTFCAGFAEFLGDYEVTAGDFWLADVARLDLAIDQALHSIDETARLRFDLGEGVQLSLPAGLKILELRHAADLIRAVIDEGDSFTALDISSQVRWLACWRKGAQAVVRPLDPAAGRFLAVLLDHRSPDLALQAAQDGADITATLNVIRDEVFLGSFATLENEVHQP